MLSRVYNLISTYVNVHGNEPLTEGENPFNSSRTAGARSQDPALMVKSLPVFPVPGGPAQTYELTYRDLRSVAYGLAMYIEGVAMHEGMVPTRGASFSFGIWHTTWGIVGTGWLIPCA